MGRPKAVKQDSLLNFTFQNPRALYLLSRTQKTFSSITFDSDELGIVLPKNCFSQIFSVGSRHKQIFFPKFVWTDNIKEIHGVGVVTDLMTPRTKQLLIQGYF